MNAAKKAVVQISNEKGTQQVRDKKKVIYIVIKNIANETTV